MLRHNLSARLLVLSSLCLTASWLWASPSSAPNTLLDVRVGPHKHFDRIVFEFENEAARRVVLKNNQTIEVHFSDIRLLDHFRVPLLPRSLTILRGIDAYREGDSGVVFDLYLARDAAPSELLLPGTPWRLALDLAPRVSEVPEDKPEYIPGDQPIPTKFAETPAANAPGSTLAETPAADTSNTAQLRAVLAFFYLAQGDTQRALEQAGLYEQISGAPLDLGLHRPAPQVAGLPEPPVPKAPTLLWSASLTILLAAVLGIGLVLGVLIRSLIPALHFRLPQVPRLPRRRREKKARDLAEEIAGDLETLDEAVQQEPPRAPVEAPPENTEAAAENDAERTLRESVMDRRVARVLELSQEGRSVSAIAEELQMGQDEVKLILDLNQQ